jgi:hypothetical protein
MTADELQALILTTFLPRVVLIVGDRPLLSVERIRVLTTIALEYLGRTTQKMQLWGYCSAFNPLAFVETIMPPNFHYLIQSDRIIFDPIRTALSNHPVIYNLDSLSDEYALLSAYGHPSRWLSCSTDLMRYAWIPDLAVRLTTDPIFKHHHASEEGSLQVRIDNAPLCTIPPSVTGANLATTIVSRAYLTGCREATLHTFGTSQWKLFERKLLPDPAQYFAERLKAREKDARIYRLPSRTYALHLLAAAIGTAPASALLRTLSLDMAKNETRFQPVQQILEVHVSASPYDDAELVYHIREKATDTSTLQAIYIDASRQPKTNAQNNLSRKYAPRRRSRSQSRSK